MSAPLALLDEPDRLRAALSPIRRRLLDRLREPASATQLAAELALGRQRVNYHLRALEKAGLLELVEQRQRRGCVERILVRTARAFVVDPAVMSRTPRSAARMAAAQDRFAAEHLVQTAARVVRDVARMQARADDQGSRLLTFTIETEVAFASPADLERFSSALSALVARAAADLPPAPGGRRYRVVIGGHPAPRQAARQAVPRTRRHS